ncbi:two-component system, OmpR family, phosphate regulon sensor histidine kinase PhoR [Rubritalea squalenifaciens DSM 18772]|uniref:histidine kinase n=1 Tax=Rubritalea squalenifaciens DSM 18772 TaxID=1123071 RepID=A0A1M6LGN3_9BACT|nr:ATP-binding protein [Rubritalea squalenifaciens]SHJ70258.1 two-component system, OmpR family, phosphate regulon sensor histidine kinase PhoR [Rubritalea squalenifaciens DSM 18772]
MKIVLLILSIVLTLACFLLYRKLSQAKLQCAKIKRESEDRVKQTHQELEGERSEQRLLLDAIGDAFLIVNGSLRVKLNNSRAQQLSRYDSLIDRTLQEIFMSEKLSATVAKQIAKNEPSQKRIIISSGAHGIGATSTEGDTAWILQVTPLPNHKEDPLYCLILRDITAEYRADQVRTDFVANASHELRTPLAIINGYLENLIDDDVVESPDMARRFLTTMRKHGDRLSRLVDDMLVVSRLESGEAASINPDPFDLAECVSDVVERLDHLIQNQGAQIITKLPKDPLIVTADKFYYTQVLFNLVENALKQNPGNNITVTVTAERIGSDRFKLAVCDDGIGIPSAHLPFIFKRFYRVDKHHTQSDIKGTGLGLSIVKRAIEAHGGTIEATSKPGLQTCFIIQSPIDSSQVSPEVKPEI